MRLTAALCVAASLSGVLYAHTDVRSVGVVGDGVADEWPALQKAIDSGHSDLYFPKGTYRLTQTLVFDLEKVGVSSVSGDGTAVLLMEGSGAALRFIGTHGGTADPWTIKPEVWERERTPMVSGIEIVGRGVEADGIEASGTMQLNVTRVVVREARHGLHLVRRNRNVVVADCYFYHNRGIGVFYDAVNLHQSNITGCHISYNGGGGVVSRGGDVRNVQISGSDIEGNQAADGEPTANVFLDSTGGSIAEVAITGCTLQHTHKAPGSANIRIFGVGKDGGVERLSGQSATNEGNVTIGNNVMSDVQVNVEIRGARGVTITGNTFWEGFEHDLDVENSSRIVVSANNFDRNPRYRVNRTQDAERNGIVFKNCEGSSFTGNIVSGVQGQPAAVQFRDVSGMMVSQNSVLNSDGAGIWLENGTDCIVSGNLIRDQRSATPLPLERGLYVVGGTGNLIGSNLIRVK